MSTHTCMHTSYVLKKVKVFADLQRKLENMSVAYLKTSCDIYQ